MKVGLLLASALLNATVAVSAQGLENVDRAMRQLVDDGQYAGIATVVWRNGKLVSRRGVGKRDLARGAAMTPDTIVRAFSMTKPITGVAMMILYDQGKWKPDDPIAKFIPEFRSLKLFKGLDRDGRAILAVPARAPTIGQLLTHTAGFKYGFDAGWVDDRYRAADIWNATGSDDFIARVARIPLAYEPGAEWHYSVSMDIEGVIVERISGMKLPDFMQRYIFDPLKMKDTGFFVPAPKRSCLATLYQWQGSKLQPVTADLFGLHPDTPPAYASGGGGLFTTADDYARFARMLLNKGALGGKRIISPGAASMMMSNHISRAILAGNFGVGVQHLRPGYAYGYNGVVVTNPAAAKVATGKGSYLWDGLASTWFWIDPEHDLVFVGMAQRVQGPETPPIQEIAQSAIREALFPALVPWKVADGQGLSAQVCEWRTTWTQVRTIA